MGRKRVSLVSPFAVVAPAWPWLSVSTTEKHLDRPLRFANVVFCL
jgi:hypothetical protein